MLGLGLSFDYFSMPLATEDATSAAIGSLESMENILQFDVHHVARRARLKTKSSFLYATPNKYTWSNGKCHYSTYCLPVRAHVDPLTTATTHEVRKLNNRQTVKVLPSVNIWHHSPISCRRSLRWRSAGTPTLTLAPDAFQHLARTFSASSSASNYTLYTCRRSFRHRSETPQVADFIKLQLTGAIGTHVHDYIAQHASQGTLMKPNITSRPGNSSPSNGIRDATIPIRTPPRRPRSVARP